MMIFLNKPKTPLRRYSEIVGISIGLLFFAACGSKNEAHHEHHEHEHTNSLWEKIFHSHDEHDSHDSHAHTAQAHDDHEGEAHEASIFISPKKQQTLGIALETVGGSTQNGMATLNFSGKIVPSTSNDWEAIAPVDGQIKMSRSFNLGDKISKGTALFTVSGSTFTEGNVERDKNILEAQILDAQAALNLAKTDFERAKKAITYQVISKDEFEHAKTVLEQAEIKVQALQQQLQSVGKKYGNNTQTVYAQQAGIIKEININQGSFVNTGVSVIKFSSNQNLMASFQVPTNQINELKNSPKAQLTSNKQTENIEKFGEQLNILPANGSEIGYATILVEVPKTLQATAGALANIVVNQAQNMANKDSLINIPKTAVLEDFGLYYCYVETEKDHFEQRPLSIKSRTNETISIEAGLKIGEKIVTKNPLQVKFSGVAAVGHSHDH